MGYSANLEVLAEAIAGACILQDGFLALRDPTGKIPMHSAHVSGDEVMAALNDSGDWHVENHLLCTLGLRYFARLLKG
ncbi:hypothetical protein UMZ34_21845 [Halopseudomonas pachastrellae]|nr:hypothetical protein UMZ34_21845 [Halopseudomonas pachastrellae]